MIFCTRIWVTDQIFAHAENKSADMESTMTFKQGVSGNPHGNRHRTRHLLNQEFMQALLLHFRQHGKKAIEKVAREQPASYLKILALLVPREHKVEHRNPVKDMTDEELEAAIEFIKKMLAAQAENAKVIDGAAEPTALAFPTEFEQPQRKRSNRLLEHVDTALGPTRKPR
jgi:Zn-dependent oligopeptidase